MIFKNIKKFSQNFHKNNFIINTILEMQSSFDIIFIQEPSWFFIWSLPSSKSVEGDELVGVPNHPNWTTFSRNLTNGDDSPRVITYINIRLTPLCFSLYKDIFNNRDISYVSFFNCGLVYFLINVYLDSLQSALKYLKDTKVNINNVLIMTSNFNIRNCNWDPNFHYHSIYKDTLIDIADSFQLDLSKPTNHVPTRYSDN